MSVSAKTENRGLMVQQGTVKVQSWQYVDCYLRNNSNNNYSDNNKTIDSVGRVTGRASGL